MESDRLGIPEQEADRSKRLHPCYLADALDHFFPTGAAAKIEGKRYWAGQFFKL